MGSAEVQGKLWGLKAKDWAEVMEFNLKPFSVAMLDATSVAKGTRFFDAGCGAGGACKIAADRGAIVSGLDASLPFVEFARDCVPDGDFRVGDLEELPFIQDLFDVVMASNSIQFATDKVAALRELSRVCISGGLIAVGTWGQMEDCESRYIQEAVGHLLLNPPSAVIAFALSAPGKLEEFVEQVDMKPVSAAEVYCPFVCSSMDEFWRGIRSTGWSQLAIREVGEARVEAAARNAAEPFLTKSGSVRFENTQKFLIAEV